MLVARRSGVLERTPTIDDCQFTCVPIWFPSTQQSSSTGDMELDNVLELRAPDDGSYKVCVYRTRPFPDRKEISVVLLSGTVRTSSKSKILAILPEAWRPIESKMFICSLEGDYIEVRPGGEIIMHSVSGTAYLDNVRFVAGNGSSSVLARFKNRSFVHCLDVKRKEPFSPIAGDLLIPVTLKRPDTTQPILSVVAFTQTGDLVKLWDDEALEVVSDILVSSLLTGPALNTTKLPLSLVAMPDKDRQTLNQRVADKLSALVFSALSGEDPQRCMRRDRHWRQTGLRSK
jgi:hypothetical protein